MRISISCFASMVLCWTSEVTFAADSNNGLHLAERWCAACHIVSSAPSKASDATPSFASIAQSADFGVEKLAFFLLEPHPKMPNMSLSRNEAQDIAAYIARLRQ